MRTTKAAVSWSGGKDSFLALHRSVGTFDVQALVTMFNEDGTRSRSHGLRREVLQTQAEQMDLPLIIGCASWAVYEEEFKRVLRQLKDDSFSCVIFGDIFPDANREWAERVCRDFGLEAIEPLWAQPTDRLLRDFLATGAEARIVATKASLLDETWLDRPLSESTLPLFQELGVDPCGERGEYHTLVVHSPRMSSPLELRRLGHLMHSGYWLLDLEVI
jgi:diphthine-ammonia ligase